MSGVCGSGVCIGGYIWECTGWGYNRGLQPLDSNSVSKERFLLNSVQTCVQQGPTKQEGLVKSQWLDGLSEAP